MQDLRTCHNGYMNKLTPTYVMVTAIAVVTQVIDGDTIVVDNVRMCRDVNGRPEPDSCLHWPVTVRLLECHPHVGKREGVTARQYLAELIPVGTRVWLKGDSADADNLSGPAFGCVHTHVYRWDDMLDCAMATVLAGHATHEKET